MTAFSLHTAPYLTNLKSLDLSWNDLKGGRIAAVAQHAARHWPQLHTLKLGTSWLGAAGMKALAGAARHWPQLQTLVLSGNDLGDGGMRTLAEHAARHWPQLHTLDLATF